LQRRGGIARVPDTHAKQSNRIHMRDISTLCHYDYPVRNTVMPRSFVESGYGSFRWGT
jgi:hypothetical protein